MNSDSDNYVLLATIREGKIMAAATSIDHAAYGQPRRMSAIPATVTAAMAAACISGPRRRPRKDRRKLYLSELLSGRN
jgi:hypothetical protein